MSKFPDHILEALRGRLGLDGDDPSKDARIERYTAKEALLEVTAWEIGDRNWADDIVRNAMDCGFTLLAPEGEDEWCDGR